MRSHPFCSLILLPLMLLFCANTSAQTVVIDTGHSPSRPGATSAMGRGEFAFNQRLAKAVALRLAARGIPVRQVEGEHALSERASSAGRNDLFVSIHHDSIQQAWLDAGHAERYAGFSLFYSGKNAQVAQSLQCARLVGRSLAQAGESPSHYHATPIPGENRPLVDPAHGVHRYDNLVVLKTSKAPAILVEGGVIVNPHEERRLANDHTTMAMGEAIARGVAECMAVNNQKQVASDATNR